VLYSEKQAYVAAAKRLCRAAIKYARRTNVGHFQQESKMLNCGWAGYAQLAQFSLIPQLYNSTAHNLGEGYHGMHSSA
jgi:hypothetical protein